MNEKDKHIKKELEEIAPLLSELKDKGDGFEAPFKYFDGLADDIMNQLEENETPVKPASDSLLNQVGAFFQSLFQPRTAMAFATVLLLLVAGWMYFPTEVNQTTTFAEVSDEILENYINENIDDFEEDLFAGLVTEDDFSSLEFEQINDTDLDKYLDEIIDDIDENTLEDLL